MTPLPHLLPPETLAFSTVADHWRHLLPHPGAVLGLSRFGDWFFEDVEGAVGRLNLVTGRYEQVAPSRRALALALETMEGADYLAQAGLVLALRLARLEPGPSQIYVYSMMPRLGGGLGKDNIQLGEAEAWNRFVAQVHRQLDAAGPNAVLEKMHVSGDGEVRLELRRG